jgi:uncharacterized membrane protein
MDGRLSNLPTQIEHACIEAQAPGRNVGCWDEKGGMATQEAQVSEEFRRHQREHEQLHGAFGGAGFGAAAEKVARFFGTPQYLVGQTIVVVLWIIFNAAQLLFKPFDPYPYILLNLAFSLQAAYAAPLILLASTRQADRDKAHEEAAANHRDEIAAKQQQMLQQNTDLTEQVATLTRQISELTTSIHQHVVEQS